LTLDPLNIELRKHGAYDQIRERRIAVLIAERNKAAHDGEFKQSQDEVRRMIDDVLDVCDQVRSK